MLSVSVLSVYAAALREEPSRHEAAHLNHDAGLGAWWKTGVRLPHSSWPVPSLGVSLAEHTVGMLRRDHNDPVQELAVASGEDPGTSRQQNLEAAGAARVPPPVETEPNAKKPPLIDNAATRKVAYETSLHMTNPLQENSPWAKIGVPIVLGLFGLTVIILAALFIGSKSDDVDENELELPENMYGELFATTVITTFRYRRDGLRLPAVCEFFSSIVLLLVTYILVFLMIQVAENTLANVAADVEERDSLFEKFRDPVVWQAQNWNMYPDTSWRRESMVWFCHDIIYGKAKHVNELGVVFYMFNWVVLLIWFAYMLNELRESWKLKMLIWDVPSVSVIDMVIIDKEEGRINVAGLSIGVKLFLSFIIIIPKLALNGYVLYIGCLFLLYNDLDDALQDILLKTIELAFILEMDELVFEAFTSHAKKQQLGQIEMPIVKERGLTRIMSRYGEFPRFIILVSIVSYLILTINNRDKAEQTLTVKQEGVIEGCCNFMQYLKGAGTKTTLAEGNPCTVFRGKYESALGLDVTGGVVPPGERPSNGVTAGSDAAGLIELSLRAALNQTMNHT